MAIAGTERLRGYGRNAVASYGLYRCLGRRQGYLRYYLRTLPFCGFREFCGRPPAAGSVNSVQSVGVTMLAAEAGDLRYYLPHPNHLCQSVKSVGGHPQQQVL